MTARQSSNMVDSNDESTISVAQALFEKYGECDNRLLENVCLSPKKAASHSPDHVHRTIISLDNYGVNSAGETGEIVKLCPRLEELDLSKNDIKDWKQIFKIVSQLPHLRHLNLSSNPLTLEPDLSALCEEFTEDCLNSLEHLILSNTELPLEMVYKVLCCFPGIKELHIGLNDYDTVPPCKSTFKNVRWISFNKNLVADWKDAEQLGQIFPNLEALMLTENPIESINLENSTTTLQELTTLSLSKSWINNWASIDALRKFHNLKDLRLVGIPLADDLPDKLRRELTIARLPNVTRLNGTLINGVDEKEDAERSFIRYHMDDSNPPARYQELVDVHGLVNRLADVDLAPQCTVTVKVQFEDEPSVLRKINTKQTVLEFKKSLSHLTDGLPPSKMRLMYKDMGMVGAGGVDEMRYPSKMLYTYMMEDGDEIHIFKKGM